jgi:hypothetical protein
LAFNPQSFILYHLDRCPVIWKFIVHRTPG